MASLQPTCVSAPGKVLLVGGYLVLKEQYSGLVLSCTTRFYSQVEMKILSVNKANEAKNGRLCFSLIVQSKQFNQCIDGRIEKMDNGCFQFRLRNESDRNPYIEETIMCAVNGIAGLQALKINDTFRQLQNSKAGVYVTLRGDNDFYSQAQRLQDAKLSLCRANVKSLEAFAPPTIHKCGYKKVAVKTGMGSSAALVTSLVASLVAFFVPKMQLTKNKQYLEIVHNLAQLCHCYVQRKIGSGFDISAACFGSQQYTRFSPSLLKTCTSEKALHPEQIARCITAHTQWNTCNRVKPLRIPSSFHLLMGDVSSGSTSVSMAQEMTKWQEKEPVKAKRMMDAIHCCNVEIEQGFAKICELEADYNTHVNWKELASHSREQWNTIDATIGAILSRLSQAFSHSRDLMREMGILAGVPIEPQEQTAILDATLTIPGVLFAGVPGAGGYDAICVLVIHDCALVAVEKLWIQWPSTHPSSIICPLLCDIDRGQTNASSKISTLQFHSIKRPILSKRKIRDEEHVAQDMTEIVTGMSNAHNTIDPVKSSELEKHERFMIPGLRFATESWAGMKTRNEDRRVTSVKWFPGPVFAIFDGHGGTFSAEYLARHLIKTVASVIRQNIGNNALTFLEQSHDQSNQESDRKKALIEHLVLLRQQLAELETLKNLESTHSPDNLQNLLDHLTEAIAQIDHEVAQIDTVEAVRHQERMQWVGTHHGHFVKSFVEAFERMDMQLLQKNPSQDGSTALLAWFVADTVCFADNTRGRATRCKQLMDGLLLYLVNVGDCRAVMCRGGQGIALTSDHKPNRPDEQKRIEKAGGFVGKIAGIARVYSAAGAGLALEHETSTYLAVSRAFGDRSLKTPTRLVSPEPEITRVVVQDQDLFLVLACDGIWDVLSEQEVVDIALPHFNDAKAAADAIVKAAYKKGSVDNLTATVIQFGWKPDAQVFEYRTRRVRSKTTAIESSCARFEDATEEIDMFNL